MNLEYRNLINPNFHPQSKVWVYQAGRLLSITQAFEAEDLIKEFITGWLSHGNAVKAEGHLFFGRFVVFIADESQTQVGGCSTDSSVRFIKMLGEKFGIDFFDRQALAFVVKDSIQILPYSQVEYAVENNFLTPDTRYFNNLVKTKQELEQQWIIPLKESWLAKKVKLSQE